MRTRKALARSSPYAELHCVSNFTFLRGASHPEELVAQAAKLNYSAIAITDECSVAGIVRAHVATREHPIHLIIGSEFRIHTTSSDNDETIKLVLLAPNRTAYAQLCTLITLGRRNANKGKYHLCCNDLLFGLDQCLVIALPNPHSEKNLEHLQALKPLFPDRLWIGVELLQESIDERAHYLALYQLAELLELRLVACNDVHMHRQERKALQDTLTAIRHNTPIDQLGNKLLPNSERYLRSVEHLRSLYPEALLLEAHRIAERCQFSLDELRYEYPHELVPKGLSASDYLRALTMQGAVKRWPKMIPPHVIQLIEKELALIADLKYEHYFLTVYDIVQFARNQNILCQGRGSAANSAVCFCLFITEVDPARSSVLFERFISKERDEPPDIDVDFEHERREEVIQYIYKKYGRDRAAIAATVITYRSKSAIRDVGKALGLDQSLIDHLAKSLAWWDQKSELLQRFQESNMQGHTSKAQTFYALVQEILGFPRHLSQHVGGFLISDQPTCHWVPIENASMIDRTIVQWDKTDIEALGLLKVDVLALGMLTAIRKSLDWINRYNSFPISISDIPAEDPKTYDMLCRADSVGVFQVESRAQMSMLPRLKPRCYYDLVVQVAIIRPGPIQGGMVHPYLRRRNGEEAITYPNETLRPVLERTLGIPIFQEQAIELSMVAAGFSAGEADQLRRAMASWGKNGELYRFKERFIQGMLTRGYDLDFSERLYKQIEGFGGYGFPESHSASFALLVYISAWLKCHYPAAFYCGLLNSLPMGFYSPSQLIQDAKRHGVMIHPIDVDCSEWDHTLELEHTSPTAESKVSLRLGLRLIKYFNTKAAERIKAARNEKSFTSLTDLTHRAELNKMELEALVQANAITRLASNRHQAHWLASAIESTLPLLPNADNTTQETNDAVFLLPPSEEKNILEDYQSVGLTLGRHPMAILRDRSPFYRCKTAQGLFDLRHKQFVRIAGLVTGRQRPGTASGVLFLTLEDETGNASIVVWKDVQVNFRQALMTSTLLLIKGIVEREGSVVHVIAGHLSDLSTHLENLAIKSRDFH